MLKIPVNRNPFADWFLKGLSNRVYVMESIREVTWDDNDRSLCLMIQPPVEADVEDLKEMVVGRIREMAIDAPFKFEVAPQ